MQLGSTSHTEEATMKNLWLPISLVALVCSATTFVIQLRRHPGAITIVPSTMGVLIGIFLTSHFARKLIGRPPS
jgi:hypothetical protein